MASLSPTIAATLVPVAELRRGQGFLRAAIALAFFAAFLRLGAPWLGVWVAAYVAAQVLEVWALWPFRADAPEPPAWRAGVALAAQTLVSAAFAALAIALWTLPGTPLPTGGTLILCGGVLNVVSISRGSPAAFLAAVSPYVTAILLMPLLRAAALGGAAVAPFALAAITFVTAAWLVWRDGHRLFTAERAAREALDDRRAQAEEADNRRRAFAAAVSHELRTPLTAILAASTTLEGRAVAAEDRATAALVTESARLMRRLLDDLLDLAKLEAGAMGVELAVFDPRTLVGEASRLWAGPAEAKGLALTLAGAEALPDRAAGDPLRLRQILNNLLSNAVKFTAEGEVRLECEAEPAEGGWRLRLAVIDTGPGLSPQAATRIFTPFAQADATVAAAHGGTGLGLAVSRELARVMGGELTGAGRGDRSGARFDLVIPLAAAPAMEQAEPPEAPPAPELRALVVDDHPVSRRAVALMLEAAGAVVSQAESGEAALARLAVEPFDIVLLDVTMPGMDGREVVRRLRHAPGPNRATPVLGVTGHAGPADAEACLAAGMDGHIAKPLEPQAFYAALTAVLSPSPAAAAEAA